MYHRLMLFINICVIVIVVIVVLSVCCKAYIPNVVSPIPPSSDLNKKLQHLQQKAVVVLCYTWTISERFRDEMLIIKRYINSFVLLLGDKIIRTVP